MNETLQDWEVIVLLDFRASRRFRDEDGKW